MSDYNERACTLCGSLLHHESRCPQAASERATCETAGPAKVVAAVATGSDEAARELKRLLRFCGERPGAAVCSERMEGAKDARHEIRAEIRARLRVLQPNAQAEPARSKNDERNT